MLKALKYFIIAGICIAVFQPASASAANRYWVGGTGSWDASGTTHWSATSGGSGGASVPTTADNVIFDSASNASAYTVTVTATASCADLTIGNPASGVITLAGSSAIRTVGSLYVAAGITRTFTGSILFDATSGNKTITTNGVSFASPYFEFETDGVSGHQPTWTLQDDLVNDGVIDLYQGTFDANNFNVTAQQFTVAFAGGSAKTVNMGNGTWTLTGTGTVWYMHAFPTTINAGSSTIKFTNTSGSTAQFVGGGYTYNTLWISRAVNAATEIYQSNTFNTFRADGTSAFTLRFSAGTTQTITNWNVSGSSGKLVTITSDTTGTHTLAKAGGGTVSSDYLSIQHSVATPSSTWYAGTHSTNNQATATAGSGWTFTAAPATGPTHVATWRGILKANILGLRSLIKANVSKWTGVN